MNPLLAAELEPSRKRLGPDLLLGKRLGPNTSPVRRGPRSLPFWSYAAIARRRRGAAIMGARRGHPAPAAYCREVGGGGRFQER